DQIICSDNFIVHIRDSVGLHCTVIEKSRRTSTWRDHGNAPKNEISRMSRWFESQKFRIFHGDLIEDFVDHSSSYVSLVLSVIMERVNIILCCHTEIFKPFTLLIYRTSHDLFTHLCDVCQSFALVKWTFINDTFDLFFGKNQFSATGTDALQNVQDILRKISCWMNNRFFEFNETKMTWTDVNVTVTSFTNT